MNAEKFLNNLVPIQREIRGAMLESDLKVRPSPELLSILECAVNRWDGDHGTYDPILADLCRKFPLENLTPTGRVAAAQLVQPLLQHRHWPGRDSVFNLYLNARPLDIETILDVCSALAAARHELSESERGLLLQLMSKHAGTNVDSVVKALDACYARHKGEKRVIRFLRDLRSRLGLLDFHLLMGPEIRQDLFLKVIDQGNSVDEDILISGPSGCGKESVAKIIHSNGARRLKPMRTYHCETGRSEINRLVRDVTGGKPRRDETLFLDEVQGLAGYDTEQQALLNCPKENGVQLISASSLAIESLKAKLVTDFFGRYCVRAFVIAPLSARRFDFVEFVTQSLEARGMDIDAGFLRSMFDRHDWPCNYREVGAFLRVISESLPRTKCLTRDVLSRNMDLFPPHIQALLKKVCRVR